MQVGVQSKLKRCLCLRVHPPYFFETVSLLGLGSFVQLAGSQEPGTLLLWPLQRTLYSHGLISYINNKLIFSYYINIIIEGQFLAWSFIYLSVMALLFFHAPLFPVDPVKDLEK